MYTFIITFRSSVFFLSIFLSLPHVRNLKVTLHFTSLLHRISTHSYLLSLIIIKCFFFSVSSLDIKLYFLFQEIVCPAFIFIPMNNKQDQRVDVSPSQQLCVFYILNISSNTRCFQCCIKILLVDDSFICNPVLIQHYNHIFSVNVLISKNL